MIAPSATIATVPHLQDTWSVQWVATARRALTLLSPVVLPVRGPASEFGLVLACR